MVQGVKTLMLLCMLIGCSQAFPSLGAAEDAGSTERRDTIWHVLDVTPPVCRVLNESLFCPLFCGNATWQVSYILSDGSGSGIDHPSFITTGSGEINITLDITKDENGYNATLVSYSGSCCLRNVEITVTDKAGNKGECPFNMHYPLTTVIPMTTSSSVTTISVGSSLLLLPLKSMLL
ncbi:hypothetical protein IRJ41_017622 [Triplophysa rosa]|uniref:Uncharacterized protein n=1 Tax=Triplophysa rosa TaxID=992332 RepID=A0A9W7TS11_TRIRA|nr:hypothetical protein IRJ41_017622 [Triplophysa rosa]